MIDSSTKLYLIKALIEGIPCEFKDIEDISKFAHELILIAEEKDSKYGRLEGDADGLILSDSEDEPFATVSFANNRIKFTLLMPEDQMKTEQAHGLTRVVLSAIGMVFKRQNKFKAVGTRMRPGEQIVENFQLHHFGIME
jgi:hypothetical protein